MRLRRPWRRMAATFVAQSLLAMVLTLLAGVVVWLPALVSRHGIIKPTTEPFWFSLFFSAIISLFAIGAGFDNAKRVSWRWFMPIRWPQLLSYLAWGRWGTLFSLSVSIPAVVLWLTYDANLLPQGMAAVAALWMTSLVAFADSAGDARISTPFVRWLQLIVRAGLPVLMIVLLSSAPLAGIRWLYPSAFQAFESMMGWIGGALDGIVAFLAFHPIGVALLVVASPCYAAFAWGGESGAAALVWTGLYFAAICWNAARVLRAKFAQDDDANEAAAFEEYLGIREEFEEEVERHHDAFEEDSAKHQVETTRAVASLPWPDDAAATAAPELVLFRKTAQESGPEYNAGPLFRMRDFVRRYLFGLFFIGCAVVFASTDLKMATAIVAQMSMLAAAGSCAVGLPFVPPGAPARWPRWLFLSFFRNTLGRTIGMAAIAAAFWSMAGSPLAGLLAAVAYPVGIAACLIALWGEDAHAARTGAPPQNLCYLAVGFPSVCAAIFLMIIEERVTIRVSMEAWLTFAPLLAACSSLILAAAIVAPSVLRRGTDMVTGSHGIQPTRSHRS